MIRFDTRFVKPKLWNLLGLSLLAGAAVALVAWFGPGDARDFLLAEGILVVYLALALILLAVTYLHQLEYNPYSYNTIYYMGFFLYTLSVLVTVIYLLANTAVEPEVYGTWPMVARTLVYSARSYLFLSFPFLLLFSLALLLSNGELLRREGRSFVNLLGVILALMVLGGEAVLFHLDRSPWRDSPWVSLFSAVFLYFECMMIGTIAADLLAAFSQPDRDRDYMIVLGCGMGRDGTPTPLLQGRLDRALAFRDRQLAETGKELIFVTSGGQGPDEVISEARCMADYLVSRGIPEDRIILEDRSVNTLENMRFSKEKIMARDPQAKVAFSTTNYHVFRSGLLSRRVKMRSIGVGAPTRWYFWPNASVREFVGLLTAHRGKQALILLGMAALYLGLTAAAR